LSKEIFLTQNKVAIVDDCDYEYLNQFKWCVEKNKNIFYASRGVRKDGKGKMLRMHSVILGDREDFECDHINGNGLDNRRSNLRLVTHRQNGQNMHILKTSQYPGVYWRKENKKWRADLSVDNKTIHLEHFDNEYRAYLTYCKAVKELTGQECLLPS
jgi:hypothetical protein